MHNVYTKMIAELARYFKQSGLDRAVIGVSGGIDSALTLKLAVDAIGADKVTGILMPEKGISSEENILHAKTLCEFLKVEHFSVQINKYLIDYMSLPWQQSDLARINIKARIRMIILYNYANTKNALVLGTSNKTELSLGYGTKHGDLAADIEVIGDLFKEDVYALAEHVGLPDEFLNKPPSAELYMGQTDEKDLGMTYKEIDSILKQAEKGISKEEIINKGINPNTVLKTFRLMELNRHKITPPYIIPTA